MIQGKKGEGGIKVERGKERRWKVERQSGGRERRNRRDLEEEKACS